MQITTASPLESIDESIATIESNTGVAEFEATEPTASTKSTISAARLAEGSELIESISAYEEARAAELENYRTMMDTNIKDVTDVTGLDLTSELIAANIDFTALGLPNPTAYNKSATEVVDVSNVDGSSWDLPRPSLANINPKCHDLSDMYLSSTVDLTSVDMRAFAMPFFDFSWATDFSFPDWINPSSVPCKYLFDLSSVDLSMIIDLTESSVPEWTNPENWAIGYDDGESGITSLRSMFNTMASDGDLVGIGSLAYIYNGARCVTTSIVDVCSAASVIVAIAKLDINAIVNYNDTIGDLLDAGNPLPALAKHLDIQGNRIYGAIDGLYTELTTDMPSKGSFSTPKYNRNARGPILGALAYLGKDWYWADKALGKYDYDALRSINKGLINYIADVPEYAQLASAAIAFDLYEESFII